MMNPHIELAKRLQMLPEPSVFNPHIFMMKHGSSKAVTYRNVHPSEDAYVEILDMITDEDMVIENIVEINNEFLEKAYLLKRAQKRLLYGNEIEEKFLFHGTKKENLDSICAFNFNWRLYGTNSGNKYGKGVSFSNNATYASYYSDPESFHKVMLAAKVLIGKTCLGNNKMILPPPYCDTSRKQDGAVFVKYEDHEFLPKYKIYYHFEDEDEDDDEEYYDEYDFSYYNSY